MASAAAHQHPLGFSARSRPWLQFSGARIPPVDREARRGTHREWQQSTSASTGAEGLGPAHRHHFVRSSDGNPGRSQCPHPGAALRSADASMLLRTRSEPGAQLRGCVRILHLAGGGTPAAGPPPRHAHPQRKRTKRWHRSAARARGARAPLGWAPALGPLAAAAAADGGDPAARWAAGSERPTAPAPTTACRRCQPRMTPNCGLEYGTGERVAGEEGGVETATNVLSGGGLLV
jgi:hypothetical protein